MAIRIPPDSLVDINVLHKQRHQQVQKEHKLKEHTAVDGKFRNACMANRFWADQRSEWWGRETHGCAAPAETTQTLEFTQGITMENLEPLAITY